MNHSIRRQKNPKQYPDSIYQKKLSDLKAGNLKDGKIPTLTIVIKPTDNASYILKLNLFPSTDYIIANIISFLLSVLWSFYWNNKYVFKLNEGEQRSIWKALLKTYVSYGFTGIILNNILLVLWVRVIGINKMLAPIINLIINIPINFFMNKLWAFGKKD